MTKRAILNILLVLIYAEYAYCQNGFYELSFLTLEYTDQVDSTNFVITSKTGATSDFYLSFGLSNDQSMVNLYIYTVYP